MTDAYAVGAAVAGSGGVGAGGGYNDGNGSSGVTGGLIGIFSGTLSGSCYFNSTANSVGIGSGTTPSDLTGESVSEFQAPSNPEGTNWDFTNTWAINASVNNGYPFFLPQILTTSPLPPAGVGQPYSYTLSGFDGAGEGLTWSSTALPNGLDLSSTGAITGTPTGGYSGDVTVSVTDSAGNTASANLQLDVVPEAPGIITQSIGPGTSLGTTEVTATPNNNGDTFAYALGSTPATTPYVGDPLPNGATTYMSGSDIPNVSAGRYLDMYEVNGSNQIQAWHEYQLTIRDINSAGPTGLTHSSVTQTGWVESWSPASGASSYNVYLGGQKVGSTTQSVYSYTFTGEKPGTTYSVQVSSVNSSGQESALSVPDSVTTAVYGGGGPIPPYINTVSFMEDAKVGTPYSAQLVTTGGTHPFQWSITNGALPQGLTLNNQGIISGTPTGLGGQYLFTVKVTDANNLNATRQLTLTVDGPTSYPLITTTSLPSATVGQSYEQTLGATGGTAPYTWSVTKGALPSGLSLNAHTGEITGSALTSGISNVTIQTIDANGLTVTKTLSIDVLRKNQREIVWNGHIQNVPTVVGNDGGTQTTYIPIWYVMQLLKSMGIQSTWNGQKWNMSTSATANLSNIQAGTGSTSIYLNGTLVQNVNTEAQVDPSTNKPTMYMPIWYVQQVLNRVGLQSTWNGTTWVVTQENS
ncbi:putative Ig domain-containing protein [Alicyclobacillus fastidiosus]|uniref:Ig domain-containing protein n=1 Tax=Alicyclobacillus fastidiosus TaxID=392011 RepID=A0ABY6ZRN8_9BACL|nr:putative Ig domain-containing protein [Alicyclobacillus fastidiosus]